MNVKDERIYKLFLRGLSLAQIARKIGMPDNIQRVKDGLHRKGVRSVLEPVEEPDHA